MCEPLQITGPAFSDSEETAPGILAHFLQPFPIELEADMLGRVQTQTVWLYCIQMPLAPVHNERNCFRTAGIQIDPHQIIGNSHFPGRSPGSISFPRSGEYRFILCFHPSLSITNHLWSQIIPLDQLSRNITAPDDHAGTKHIIVVQFVPAKTDFA